MTTNRADAQPAPHPGLVVPPPPCEDEGEPAGPSVHGNVIPITGHYVPPSLERSGSVSIAPLKNRHPGQTCYIVGKGPSLERLRAHHFGPGPVLVINETIRLIQTMGLPNQVYSMQKDGCMTADPHNQPRPCSTCQAHGWKRPPVTDPYPGIAVLFSQHFSSWCLHGRPNRFVFTDAELGYAGYPGTMSTLEAIHLALHLGAAHVVMMCFDSLVTGNTDTLVYMDGERATLNYAEADIAADLDEMRYNLEWLKPRARAALAHIPHSFFTP